jgi:hypothetical protein
MFYWSVPERPLAKYVCYTSRREVVNFDSNNTSYGIVCYTQVIIPTLSNLHVKYWCQPRQPSSCSPTRSAPLIKMNRVLFLTMMLLHWCYNTDLVKCSCQPTQPSSCSLRPFLFDSYFYKADPISWKMPTVKEIQQFAIYSLPTSFFKRFPYTFITDFVSSFFHPRDRLEFL